MDLARRVALAASAVLVSGLVAAVSSGGATAVPTDVLTGQPGSASAAVAGTAATVTDEGAVAAATPGPAPRDDPEPSAGPVPIVVPAAATADGGPRPTPTLAPPVPIAGAPAPGTAGRPDGTTVRPTSGPRPTFPPFPSFDPPDPSAPVPVGEEVEDFGFQAGRRSWTVEQDGITATLTLSTATPTAGEPVEVRVESSDTGGTGCCFVFLRYGDGLQEQVPADCRASGTTHSDPQTWNRPGRWVVFVQVMSSCTERDRQYDARMRLVVEVGPGTSAPVSNGPVQPVLGPLNWYGDAPRDGYVQVHGQATELDGYLTRFVVDWGDGTAPQSHDPLRIVEQRCVEGAGGQPGPDRAVLSDPYEVTSHQYARPGTYVITVTVVSAGCDGRDPQTATQTLSHTWTV